MKILWYPIILMAFMILAGSCAPKKEAMPFDPGSVSMYQPGKDTPQGITSLFIDAKKEAMLGNEVRAEALYLHVIEKDPRHDAAYYELANLYLMQKNTIDAQLMAEKAVDLDPSNEWYQVLLGEIYQRNQEYSGAIDVFTDLIRMDPQKLEYRLQLAASYVFAGKFNDALKELDIIEDRMGIREEIIRQKEKLYIYMRKVDAAAAEVQKLIETFPSESRYYAWLAELYMSNGMPDKALPVYLTIAEKFPDDPYIHISLSDYYRQQGDEEKASEELKRGFENPNLDIDTKIQVMLTYYTVSELLEEVRSEAMELAEILIRVHPDNPKSFSMYADFLVREERYEEARDAFRRVMEMDSSRFLVWESLLRIEAELGDYQAMRSESRRMIDLFPLQPMGYLFHGAALMQLDEYENAIEAFRQGSNLVVANNLLQSQFNAYLGDAYYQTGDIVRAFEHYEKTLRMAPNNSYVLNNYAYYLALRNQDLEKAESMARKATELDPENSANLDTYGWVLFRLSRFAEAETWIKKALDNGGMTNAVILEHYGDVLYKLDHPIDALHYWRMARDTGAGSEWLEKKVDEGVYYE